METKSGTSSNGTESGEGRGAGARSGVDILVEVRMGVEVQDLDRPMRRGDALHRRPADRMVAAERDRDRARGGRRAHRLRDHGVIALALDQGQVAVVLQRDLRSDLVSVLGCGVAGIGPQRRADMRGRLGRSPQERGIDVGRGVDQGDVGFKKPVSPAKAGVQTDPDERRDPAKTLLHGIASPRRIPRWPPAFAGVGLGPGLRRGNGVSSDARLDRHFPSIWSSRVITAPSSWASRPAAVSPSGRTNITSTARGCISITSPFAPWMRMKGWRTVEPSISWRPPV